MIAVRGLTKRFGELDVLCGVDVDILRGCVTGIVGPNAAGKTTLIKSILGLTRADRGEIHVDGERVNGDESYRAKIGYMPQIARFPANLTGHELLAMLSDLRPDVAEVDLELVAALGLEPELKKRLSTLSGGTKQKITAVAALMFSPEILILDEPTAGLDPRSAAILKDRILAEKARGRTIIITSHIMSELEALAEQVVFISEGRVKFAGSIDEMMTQTRQVNLERAVATLIEHGAAA